MGDENSTSCVSLRKDLATERKTNTHSDTGKMHSFVKTPHRLLRLWPAVLIAFFALSLSSEARAQTLQETVAFILNEKPEAVTVDKENCVATWKSILGNKNTLYLNRVVLSETRQKVEYSRIVKRMGTVLLLYGEEPIHCWDMSGGGNSCSRSFDRIWSTDSQRAKRKLDAVRHLYRNFCTGTKRKRAY